MTLQPAGATVVASGADPQTEAQTPPGGIPAGEPPEFSTAPPPDPAWTRPALAALLVGTAIAYLWNLSINRWGNDFYAAAVQAGTQSWKAFFFGSFDSSSYITVDKPPASLWIMELSGRIFGFSSWSMLAPEALLGVASVGLLYLTVRRVWGAQAGLLAGLALAVTPVATLMFRFNNPDAALTFILVAAAYTTTRALERASTRWLLATGALIGTAFLTKELQALLVVPGLALAYLVAAPAGIGRRVWQLLLSGVAMAVSGLWWPVLVDLLPAASRPFIGGSTDNSVLGLALGYNGLGRLTGNESTGAGGGFGGGGFGGGGPGGGGGFSGSTGIGRLLNAEFGGFIGWLIPAALAGVLAAAWLTRRAGRTDPRRASLILWTGWFVVTAAVFSFSKGIIHTYYGVALAPAVAALAAMTVPALWRARTTVPARLLLAAASVGTGATAYALLNRDSSWLPWVRWAVLAVGLLAAVALLLAGLLQRRFGAQVMTAVAAIAVFGGLAGPAAWSFVTIGQANTGAVPGVGPAGAQQFGFGGGPGGPGAGPGAGGRLDLPANAKLPDGMTMAELQEMFRNGGPGGPGAGPGGGGPGGDGLGDRGGRGGGGPGGTQSVDAALVSLVRAGSTGYTWAAAAQSSMTAGPLELASKQAVMSLGGFSGSDPAITLDAFKKDVAAHKVHYYVSEGGRGGFAGFGGRNTTDGIGAIDSWITSAFTAKTVGSSTVYDLTAPKA